MKKSMLLFFAIILLSLLGACINNNATVEPPQDEDKIATIVAGTLSAIPSSTPISTEPFIPTPTNTALPYNIYQHSDFGFGCLYPLHMSFTEWEGTSDTLLFSMSFNRLEDKESNIPQKPEISIAVFVNSEALPIEQWLTEHTGPDAEFLSTSAPIELNVDGHHAIFFKAERVMVGTWPRLLIENGQRIISISYYTWDSVSLREEFLIIASSLKFSLSKDDLDIDRELYEDLNSAISTLSQ
jgi:hypothetical protein